MQQVKYSIVQVTDQLNVGGAEQIIVMLANLLQAHGHRAAVVTTVAPGSLAKQLHSNVQHMNLNRRWRWNLIKMYRLAQALKKFDIVHVHSSYNLRYVYLASRLFFLRKPIFYHEHFGDININTSVAWHQKIIYPNIIFIAVSKQLAAWAIDQVKLAPKHVFLLQNTIAKQEVKPANLSSPPYQLLLVANFRRTKNIEFAIELLHQLNSSSASYYLTIIGQINDAFYYKEILQLITKYSLTKQVQFVHNCTNIQPLLSSYHIAIHTSKSETGPLVLIEYIAQGLPFISFNTGEVVQQLQDHLHQFIMQDFDTEKWIKAIKEIIALPRLETSSRLIHLYRQHFSPEAYYNQCMEIYKKGLQCKPQ